LVKERGTLEVAAKEKNYIATVAPGERPNSLSLEKEESKRDIEKGTKLQKDHALL